MNQRINPILAIAVLGVLLTTEVVVSLVYTAQALGTNVPTRF